MAPIPVIDAVAQRRRSLGKIGKAVRPIQPSAREDLRVGMLAPSLDVDELEMRVAALEVAFYEVLAQLDPAGLDDATHAWTQARRRDQFGSPQSP